MNTNCCMKGSYNMKNVIINFAPTGMLMKKKDTPYIPTGIKEIVEEVREAYHIGISSVHLHARNENEEPCWEKEVFAEIISGIRKFAPELVISVTTSGRVYNTLEKRIDVLKLQGWEKPDMASLTLSSLNFNKTASMNEPNMIKDILSKMNENRIKPELEAFDSGMINYSKYLIRKEMLKPPFYYNMIMGNIACAQPTLLHAGIMANDVPNDAYVCYGGIGNAQLPINSMAIAMGYGIRIGLEDNIWLDAERTVLATNLDYLKRIHTVIKAMGRQICSSNQLRRALHLDEGKGKYGCL